jgi:hypothetical protein
MAHQVWYALYYDKDAEPFVDMVTLPPNNNITLLRQAVYDKSELKQLGYTPIGLKVYPVGTDVTTIDASTSALKLSMPVSSLVTTDEQPVIVVARIPQISSNASATAAAANKRSRATTDEGTSQSNLAVLALDFQTATKSLESINQQLGLTGIDLSTRNSLQTQRVQIEQHLADTIEK